ncbi:MAG: hypothetical protein ACOCX4_02360 [Planctomycetota bacterium]
MALVCSVCDEKLGGTKPVWYAGTRLSWTLFRVCDRCVGGIPAGARVPARELRAHDLTFGRCRTQPGAEVFSTDGPVEFWVNADMVACSFPPDCTLIASFYAYYQPAAFAGYLADCVRGGLYDGPEGELRLQRILLLMGPLLESHLFGRPAEAVKRRRYDPADLPEVLSRQQVAEVEELRRALLDPCGAGMACSG